MTPLFVTGEGAVRSGASAGDARTLPRIRGSAWREVAGLRVRLHVPGGLAAGRHPPLLLFLHGCGRRVEEAVRIVRLDRVAGESGMVVACPEQDRRLRSDGCWRWRGGTDAEREEEDVARILSVLRDVTDRVLAPVGPVCVAGFGAGAALASRVAASSPGSFSALALHSGVPVAVGTSAPDGGVPPEAAPDAEDEAVALLERMGPDRRALPVFAIQGSRDDRTPPILGLRAVEGWMALHRRLGLELRSPEMAVGRGTRGGRRYRRTLWRDREGELRGESWLVEGLGHSWSGGRSESPGSRSPDATREMLRFFGRVTSGEPPPADGERRVHA